METSKSTPIFSRAQLITLIWPLLLEQLLSVSMGFADTFMVSGVSEAAVSSVSLVDSLNVLLTQILSALSTGGAVVASQYLGHKDMKNARHNAAQLFSIMCIATLSMMTIALLFSHQLLGLIFGAIDTDVMAFAQTYFCITAISYPFIGLYNVGAALFRAQGNSKISMNASLVMNLINIIGNAILIYGFHMGVMGAAIATLVGRIFAAAWLFWRNQQEDNPLRITNFADMKPAAQPIKRILRIGIPSGLENGMFHIGKLCVTSLVATLGTAAIAANAVANSICNIANIPGSTMSLATIPVVGRCLGAGEKQQAKHYGYVLMVIALSGLLISNISIFFLIPTISQWFHLSTEAADLCILVIRWFDIVSIFFWATSFTLPNVLRSGGDVKYTMTTSIISMWFCRVILSYFFVNQLHMGLLGVWMGMFSDWVIRSIFFVIRFLNEKWMEHRVI